MLYKYSLTFYLGYAASVVRTVHNFLQHKKTLKYNKLYFDRSIGVSFLSPNVIESLLKIIENVQN